jgi:hypothetical protein
VHVLEDAHTNSQAPCCGEALRSWEPPPKR